MCVKCRSAELSIRRVTGIERIAVFFTQKRKFVCRDCGFTFRAIDRRRDRREEDAYAVNRASGLPAPMNFPSRRRLQRPMPLDSA